jgi:SAM-dependent methyltransferase/glycosyltransferase involved in cell wall biosynthesis
MRNNARPMVSCVCVTRKRVAHLKRSIECFLNQTYPNKELVILFESDDQMTGEYLNSIGTPNIRSHEISSVPRRSLGHLRNLSVEIAAGEFYCQWDDDDWHHPSRIEMQMNCLADHCKDACFLANWFIYDAIGKRAYLSCTGPWAGSMLCRTRVLSAPIQYSDLDQNEGDQVMWEILKLKLGIPLIRPSLYISIYHGQNTVEGDHFKVLFEKSQVLPYYISELFEKIVDDKTSYGDACEILSDTRILRELDYSQVFRGNQEACGHSLPKECRYIDRLPRQAAYNAVLRSSRDFRKCRRALQMLNLPVHIDSPKNWDSYAALDIILRHSGDDRSGKLILDAGGEYYSAILPQLAACGFENLFCINLAINETEVKGKISYEFGDITGTRFPDAVFDFIVCLSVIEHGVDLGKYLTEMARILKGGGILITSTDYWVTPVNTENKTAYGVPVRVFDRDDILHIVELASRTGFILKGHLDLECDEKTIGWLGMEYTFIYFTFERASSDPVGGAVLSN